MEKTVETFYLDLLFYYYIISPYKVKRTRKIWDGIDYYGK